MVGEYLQVLNLWITSKQACTQDNSSPEVKEAFTKQWYFEAYEANKAAEANKHSCI